VTPRLCSAPRPAARCPVGHPSFAGPFGQPPVHALLPEDFPRAPGSRNNRCWDPLPPLYRARDLRAAPALVTHAKMLGPALISARTPLQTYPRHTTATPTPQCQPRNLRPAQSSTPPRPRRFTTSPPSSSTTGAPLGCQETPQPHCSQPRLLLRPVREHITALAAGRRRRSPGTPSSLDSSLGEH